MNRFSRSQRSLGALLLALGASLMFTILPAQAQEDALDTPPLQSSLAQRSLLMDLKQIDDRLIAVGERGHVLISDDDAVSWRQMPTPVRVTLTASYFVDKQQGWVVGHDGVVLRTQNGGQDWTKQLDGYQANVLMLRRANQLVMEADEELANAPPEELSAWEAELENRIFLAEDAEAFMEEGASRPFLDLWFQNDHRGIIVGAFGLILETRDGGASWTPLTDRLDNPSSLHLNAIRQIGDRLFIAAEAGTLFRSDDRGESWQQLSSPYEGSFFGVVGTDSGRIIAYGLRGNAFQSQDWGESWLPIETEADANLYGGTLLDDGTAVLVGAAGIRLHISTNGTLLGSTQLPQRLPLSTVIATDHNNLLTVGLAGLSTSQIQGGDQQ